MKSTSILGVSSVAVGLLLTAAVLDTNHVPEHRSYAQTGEGTQKAPVRSPMVSMVALLSSPERFQGQEIVVFGFVGIDRAYAVIGLDKDTLTYGILPNTILIDATKCENGKQFFEQASGGCCCLRGVFEAKRWDRVTGLTRPTLLLKEFKYRCQAHVY